MAGGGRERRRVLTVGPWPPSLSTAGQKTSTSGLVAVRSGRVERRGPRGCVHVGVRSRIQEHAASTGVPGACCKD